MPPHGSLFLLFLLLINLYTGWKRQYLQLYTKIKSKTALLVCPSVVMKHKP